MTAASANAAISSCDELADLYPAPNPLAVAMRKGRLDSHHIAYIQNSPLAFLATIDADGRPQCSPRGGAPGFVRVLDPARLVFADRPGNYQIKALRNLVGNPRVALLFLVPGIAEVCRVEGAARVTTDPEQMAGLSEAGRPPRSAIVIDVDAAFLHCGKALLRSRVWHQDAQVAPGLVPSFGEAVIDQANLADTSIEEADRLVEHEYTENI